MKKDRSFTELIALIEDNRKEWLQNAPTAAGVQVSKRTESLTVRLSKDEDDALDDAAMRLGIAKSSLLRIIIRNYLGLGRGSEEVASAGSSRGRSSAVKVSAGRTLKSRRA